MPKTVHFKDQSSLKDQHSWKDPKNRKDPNQLKGQTILKDHTVPSLLNPSQTKHKDVVSKQTTVSNVPVQVPWKTVNNQPVVTKKDVHVHGNQQIVDKRPRPTAEGPVVVDSLNNMFKTDSGLQKGNPVLNRPSEFEFGFVDHGFRPVTKDKDGKGRKPTV